MKIKLIRKPGNAALDKLASQIVRKLANGKCFLCGKPGTQCCHVFSKKAYPRSRWNIANLRWGCFGCHKGSRHSMHEDPEWFREQFDKKYGEGAWDKLKIEVRLESVQSGKLDYNWIKTTLGINLAILEGKYKLSNG